MIFQNLFLKLCENKDDDKIIQISLTEINNDEEDFELTFGHHCDRFHLLLCVPPLFRPFSPAQIEIPRDPSLPAQDELHNADNVLDRFPPQPVALDQLALLVPPFKFRSLQVGNELLHLLLGHWNHASLAQTADHNRDSGSVPRRCGGFCQVESSCRTSGTGC